MFETKEKTLSVTEATANLQKLLDRKEELLKGLSDPDAQIAKLTAELGKARLEGKPTGAIHKQLADAEKGMEATRAAIAELELYELQDARAARKSPHCRGSSPLSHARGKAPGTAGRTLCNSVECLENRPPVQRNRKQIATIARRLAQHEAQLPQSKYRASAALPAAWSLRPLKRLW